MTEYQAIIDKASSGMVLDEQECMFLCGLADPDDLLAVASSMRDDGFNNLVTYSRKVFIPLTHLCRDVCHYCTFAQTPKFIGQAYMSADEVVGICKEAANSGCKEALFTLGEKPELRYATARQALDDMGFSTTLEYVAHVAGRVLEETGVLPHINAGCMTADEINMLRPVSASMGIMLESASERLCEKGMPHYGSPDKAPERRLETLRLAGQLKVPFTTGILIGIGETRQERIESLLKIREIHHQYGHIQEVIIQNFRAKPGTKMVHAPEPDLEELLWTIAMARLVFGAGMSIQAPPNLSPGVLPQLVNAGINDWGGVSPVTPDFVNPEAPWPHLVKLASETRQAGKLLCERLTIYPRYIRNYETWLDEKLQFPVLDLVDAHGLPRQDDWQTGSSKNIPLPLETLSSIKEINSSLSISQDLNTILGKARRAEQLNEDDIVRLFQARGDEFLAVCHVADEIRKQEVGDAVSFTINRNINYTNICYFKCKFCAFSKGSMSENLRGKPYDLSKDEITRRTLEAWERGATEVCMQGGIHPSYNGNDYLKICHTVKEAVPDMHIHAFSPLEVWQGAASLGLDLETFLAQLKKAGLGTLPGTAAEVLDDEVRSRLCADKINTAQWLEVMRTAHQLGIRSTATIMFGHIDSYQSWARHLLAIRSLQEETGGFTEFVPLPFVAAGAPIYLKRQSRRGPDFRESVLMHAVSRLVFHGLIQNIQTSWVKMGIEGAKFCLHAGANDLGGTLMNESITRSAGASHGQEQAIDQLENLVHSCQRQVLYRTTLYQPLAEARIEAARKAKPLEDIELTEPEKQLEKVRLIKPGNSLDPRDLKEVI